MRTLPLPEERQDDTVGFALIKSIRSFDQIVYRHVSVGTVGQEAVWMNLRPFEINSVVARSWGILNLNKVFIVPGFHAIFIKLLEHFACQSFVARRTSPMVSGRKLTMTVETKRLQVYWEEAKIGFKVNR